MIAHSFRTNSYYGKCMCLLSKIAISKTSALSSLWTKLSWALRPKSIFRISYSNAKRRTAPFAKVPLVNRNTQ